MSFLKETFENIKLLIDQHTKQTVIICAILIFMTVCAVFMLIFSNISFSKKDSFQMSEKLYLSEKLLLPKNSLETQSYIQSRKTPEKWSKEEAEKYFTLPSQSEVQKLSDSNKKIINEILGATP